MNSCYWFYKKKKKKKKKKSAILENNKSMRHLSSLFAFVCSFKLFAALFKKLKSLLFVLPWREYYFRSLFITILLKNGQDRANTLPSK
jgi:hypothetical protein